MLDQLLHIAWIERVQYVPEVGVIRQSTLGQLRGKEPHEALVGIHHWPECLDRKLIVEWYADSVDLTQLE